MSSATDSSSLAHGLNSLMTVVRFIDHQGCFGLRMTAPKQFPLAVALSTQDAVVTPLSQPTHMRTMRWS